MNGIREQCLEQLRKAIPEAMELMESPAGELSLANYARAMPGGGPALQDADDLIALAQTEAGRLFSPATARLCAGNWKTASSPSRQTITAWTFIRNFCRAISSSHLVVRRSSLSLPGGGVPCNNMAYPRGLLLPPPHSGTTKPGRFPALAAGDRHALVSAPNSVSCVSYPFRP